MKKELKDKWIAALRSGEYKQGKARLKTDDGGYCCLGVLADICKLDLDHELSGNFYVSIGTEGYPEELQGNFGLPRQLAAMNDGVYDETNPVSKQHSFLEIADWIENNIPGD